MNSSSRWYWRWAVEILSYIVILGVFSLGGIVLSQAIYPHPLMWISGAILGMLLAYGLARLYCHVFYDPLPERDRF